MALLIGTPRSTPPPGGGPPAPGRARTRHADRGLSLLPLLLAAGAALPCPVLGQQASVPPKPASARYGEGLLPWERPSALRPAVSQAPASTTGNRVSEAEPNNTLAQANRVSLGDIVSGQINPAGDADHFSFEVQGTPLLELAVRARAIGSPLDPTLTLLGPNGAMVAYNDDHDGFDSRILYAVTQPGTYVAMVRGYGGQGGTGYAYELVLGVAVPAPGDPPRIFATGVGTPFDLAAAADGSLFVTDPTGGAVRRVVEGAVPTQLVTGLRTPLGAVIDGFGKLLVVENGTGQVLRVDPASGAVTQFTGGLQNPVAITVGPDAAVWVADRPSGSAGVRLQRYDLDGERESTTVLQSMWSIRYLAFSPAGALHASDGEDGVFRIQGSTATRVIRGPICCLEAIAFDEEGHLYVVNGYLGNVTLYGPDFSLQGTVARMNIGGPSNLAFLRDAEGRMTRRLLVSNLGWGLQEPLANAVVELNSAGVRAPGHRVGADLIRIAGDSLPRGFMGAPYRASLRLADGGEQAVTWTIVRGSLPQGVRLVSQTGVLEGIPEESGRWSFRVRVDAGTRFGLAEAELEVRRPVIAAQRAASHLLGDGAALGADEQRFLDMVGNRNGRFDLGDLVLLLENQSGGGPAAAVPAPPAAWRIP